MTALKQQQRLREADLHRQLERSRNESVERTTQLLANLEAAEAAHADAMQRMVEQHQVCVCVCVHAWKLAHSHQCVCEGGALAVSLALGLDGYLAAGGCMI
jgi:sigma54-dependent transcription regulator